ncbi:endopeptidase La [Dissulfurirhabdus thermomarina]|uniref:Lon protease n=1 Tax=Dissulfurirhabdus thermomarina TaxID=1765737 RepID=A0A6N9TQQ0_DISTH|nr:endopeptidase La [Dissulfurirhabdus thermomarina]NDY43388.1 endopeptidase La [Dissulfurirhabdus thermomarina]NMX22594.1 endopeptidase La [Dissulfurirhabdus thermomarina]
MDMDDTVNGGIDFDEQESVEIPEVLPLMAVRDVVVFPAMILPLFVGREASVAAVNEALAGDRLLFLVAQRDGREERPAARDLYGVGVVAMIMRTLQLPDGRLKILAQALARGRIEAVVQERPHFRVRVAPLREEGPGETSVELEAVIRNVREQAEKLLSLKGVLTPEVGSILNNVDEPGRLADIVASNLQLKVAEAQELLELEDPVRRLHRVNGLLARELEVSTVQAKIQSDAKEEMTRTQREYFLREQLRAIKRELGEIDEKDEELEEFRERIRRAKMPPDVEKEALKQLQRLEGMHPEAAETSMVRTYLDWLTELPWSRRTRDKLDVRAAKAVLDEDHYDLDKVKDRILEYIAVRKLNPGAKGPILCFVGPPGVGKTSLGRSIARALGRKFVRVSLGGVRDEAEIRGHRRTYIGALPGRIIQGLKRAGSNNPVFMMDEVDKIGADFRGDPAAALLEVLDPEQNVAFSDHYLDVPFDLSGVLFVLTANVTDTIPSALLDRLEVITLAGYTADEKRAIARRYLIPRQLREHGLKKAQLEISDSALDLIIEEYTQEAGLRELERQIGAICRKVARRIAEEGTGTFRVTRGNLHKYLGIPRYLPEFLKEESQVGVANGLAWTPYGGEMLQVEVTVMKGKGNVTLTGLLGEVMRESAQAAVSYARSRAERFGLDPDLFDESDIHIHVPSGAIPKDGPSAGVTMTTALVSALLEHPVNRDVAMTGEITLRGRVLPIGGLKEKALAALRADIPVVIIPEQNERDLEEIPPHVRRHIDFRTVRHMDEVLELALGPPPWGPPGKRRRRPAGRAGKRERAAARG